MTARTTLLVSDGTAPWHSAADRLADMPEIDIVGLVTDFDAATTILHQQRPVAVLSAAEVGAVWSHHRGGCADEGFICEFVCGGRCRVVCFGIFALYAFARGLPQLVLTPFLRHADQAFVLTLRLARFHRRVGQVGGVLMVLLGIMMIGGSLG